LPRSTQTGRSGFAALFGGAFVVYSTVLSLSSSYSGAKHAVTWILLTALLLVVVPQLLSRYDGERTLRSAFDVLAVGFAAMALAESIVKHNPLDHVYATSADHLTQDWSVYRVFTTLGHPLVNGTVFAITLTVVWSNFLRRPSWARLAVLVGLLGAIFVTASRAALLAAVVGATVVVLIHAFRRGGNSRKVGALVVLLIVGAGASLAWSSSVLGERNDSLEGENSADLRVTLLRSTPHMLKQTHFLGSGADTSFAVWHAVGGYYAQFPLENSLIQFVVDFGVVGTALYVAFALVLVVPAMKRGAVAGPAALAAYLVAAGGFNLFEAYTSALILPCLLLTLTLMEGRLDKDAGDDPQGRVPDDADRPVSNEVTGVRAPAVLRR
jgi:hypothetical protein